MSRVLVTGATGFVGGHLCRELAARGFSVRGTVRGEGSPLPPGVEAVRVPDLATGKGLDSALNGITHVIHLAARVHVARETTSDPLAAFRRANVDGTVALLHAARKAGTASFFFLSSVKVNGDGGEIAYTPEDLPSPVGPYGVSKWEAEQAVAQEWPDGQWVILRPPLVYGPGVGGNFRRLLGLAALGAHLPVPLGGIANRRSLIYVGNLVHAILHLAGLHAVSEPGTSHAGTYLVADGDPLSTSELVRRMGVCVGRPVRMVPCPTKVLRRVGRLLGRAADVDRLLGSLVVDSSRLTEAGWVAPFRADDGLAETVRWWREAR